MNENGNSGLYSWPVIIILLCVFWPAGLFLLLKKFSMDKRAAVGVGSKGLKAVGIALIVLGVLAMIGSTSQDDGSSALLGGLFFIIGGIALMNKAKKILKEAETTKQYLAIIVNGNVRRIDSIAAATGKSCDVVKAEVQKMIKNGYLKNAYINENTREVVLPVSAPAGAPVYTGAAQTAGPVRQPTAKVVACPCCGANNTIYGATGECEYCGSPIK